MPLTTSEVGAAWVNYTPSANRPPPTQLPPGEFLVVEAEGDSSISDPDDGGSVWTAATIAPFIAVLAAAGFQAEADCECDGDVDFLDVAPFIAILSGQ